MDERLINNATFSKICDIMRKKESLWKGFKPILQAIMLVVPSLVNKDLAAAVALDQALDQGLCWIESSDIIENAVASIKNL